ncbi:hypothetical protein [Halomonas sp. MM17-34]|uniref:hypothetical protein n=1 Tax=Halomonas sp. MM17-34 TaxID=2917742 RepID=UPI001EF5A242|nr:hypothetical protein [Halomonas sp. MM17-34]MCG7605729.1 hypothetical protein [Halomonas sp. MM17-34]
MRLDELYLPESPEFACASHDIAEAQCYLARLVNGADLDVERLCAVSMTLLSVASSYQHHLNEKITDSYSKVDIV